MKYGHVPEQFSQVDLEDRTTWHRTTLREWLDQRFSLLTRKQDLESNPDGKPLTAWELKFLGVTECLEEALVSYERGFHRTTIGLLFHWIMSIEDEQELAKKRFAERRRFKDSVSLQSDRRLKSNRNPFYPRPLELIHIDRVVHIIVANLVREFDVFHYFKDLDNAYDYEPNIEFPEFVKTNPSKLKLIRFHNYLKRYGYLIYAGEQDLIDWEGWAQIGNETLKTLSRSFLAFLFNVSTSTIRRDLSKGRLTTAYKDCGLSKEHWVFVEKNEIPKSGVLFRSGWASRISGGSPNSFDLGPIFNRLPYYNIPLHFRTYSGI